MRAICPRITTDDGGGMLLVLPGDPLHSEPARVFPHRTRFVLSGNRFVSLSVPP